MGSFQCDPEGNQQTLQLEGSQVNLDCPVLASKGVVPRSCEVLDRHTEEATAQEGPLKAAALPQVSYRSPRATASRVETVERFVRYQGYVFPGSGETDEEG